MTDDSSILRNDKREVFVSYASQDAAVANAVVEALENANLKCWIAPRDVVPGEFYAGAIVHAIDAARAMVLVLSESAAISQHVLREVERASSKKHPVVSFRVDLAPLPADLEYFINTSQWLDASSIGLDRALPKLVDAVQRAVGPTSGGGLTPSSASAGAAVPPNVRPSAATKPPIRPGLAVIALVAGIAVALAYFVVDKSWLSKRPIAPQAISTAQTAVDDKSIAVLPFADMSEKQDHEYFADGMAEEILNLLAKIPGLRVTGRTSSFQFKGKNADLRTIGTQLNAAYVLEGSVRTSGDQVRVTAQLINTRTGAHEWSETYDRAIGDVLKLQDAIAAAVVRELQFTVEDRYLTSRPAVTNPDAYDLVLRGRHALDRWDQEGLEEAVNLFRKAVSRDPASAEAAAGLASALETQGEFDWLAPALAFEQARRAATTALTLDPKSAEAHAVLGRIHTFYDFDWVAAGQEYQQAMLLAPGNTNALDGQAQLSLALGHLDEALRYAKEAIAQDPLDASNYVVLSWIQAHRGHMPDAEADLRRALEIRPGYAWGHYFWAS